MSIIASFFEKIFREKKIRILLRPFMHFFRIFSKFIPKDQNLWAFGSFGAQTFSGNPKYLFLELQERKDIETIWITENKDVLKKLRALGFQVYHSNSLKGILKLLRAKFTFFDYCTQDLNYWFAGGSIKVNLWHGLPLKRIANDDKNDMRNTPNPIKRLILKIFRPWTFEKWDYTIATSEIFVKGLSSGLGIPEDHVIITGYPRNDVLFKKIRGMFIGSSEEIYKRLKELKTSGKKLFAYFPTFRESGENPIDFLDLDQLNRVFKNYGAYLIIKPHPYTPFKPDRNYSNIVFVEQTFDFYPLLLLIDVLITDYSSIYLDFLILNRPVIFYPYDLEEYLSKNRDMYFKYEDFTPGEKARDFPSLIKHIEDHLSGNDPFKEARDRFVTRIYKFRDGEAARRIYEFFKKI